MSGTWSWISRRREQEILDLQVKHFTRILSVAEESIKVIEAMKTGNVESVIQAYASVKEAERAADKVKDEIITDLSKGIFHPIDREELLRLVLVSDDIADHLNAATRRLLLYMKVEKTPPPENIIDGFLKIAEIAKISIEKIIEAAKILRRDPSRAVAIAREVERLEEEADEIRSTTEEEIIDWCDKKGKPGSCITLYKALQSLETSTDKCEDTGDVIRSIAILS
ncbi:MAG: DUF47 family protein [Desulfurococcales archaeon]|nr:DUF47 family protein [Desulfurococcales archaeon]MCE4623067.1 DUF47 family protein [Desulfurococcales archaeon]MCE4629964.1 DUF47 family protein [Desulfurococcales archaeon]